MNYLELLDKVYSSGQVMESRGEPTRELMGVDLDINGTHLWAWERFRSIDYLKRYMLKEWAWYLSGDRDSRRIAESARLWGNIQNSDGTVNSNYGYLVFYSAVPHPSLGKITYSPFQWAYRCLVDDKNSRQAIITYNTSGYNFKGNRDYICTQHQAFYIRNNKLDCYIALRSSDMVFGLTYNIPWWNIVAQQLLLYLKNEKYPELQPGKMRVNIYSCHIYRRHFELVEKMLENRSNAEQYSIQTKKIVPIGLSFEDYEREMSSYFEIRRI